MQTYISGSLAFDRIMTFPGKFSDHILPDKIHILNVCFLVDGLEERFGGTAGNIAYNMALLDESPVILSVAGKDFSEYAKWLESHGLSMEGIRRLDDEFTAGAYITTDQSDNQITGFNPAAMKFPCEYNFPKLAVRDAMGIISPGNLDDMNNLPEFFREKGVPYIFDPGQQITAFNGDQLKAAIMGSAMLVTNDYELEMIMKATNLDKAELLEMTGAIVTTLGEKGSSVLQKGKAESVDVVPAKEVKDPTGAGDAFRSGMLKGLGMGLDLPVACQLGATCASFCVEKSGTQEHKFTMDEFWARHTTVFPDPR